MRLAAGPDGWELHAVFVVALVVMAGGLLFDDAPWYGYVLLLALAAWYAALAAPVAAEGAPRHDLRGLVYLIGASLLLGGVVLASPFAAVLLSVLYTHAFWLLERLWLATLASGVATAVTALTVSVHFEGHRMGTVLVLAMALSSFLIGNGIGHLTRRRIEQEREREQLIEDLRDARAELAAAHRREGARGERERMAREIHDTLAQGFTSLVMLVQAADAAVDTDPGLTHHQLELAERTARENLAEARALVHAQQPAGLGQSSLDAVVHRLAVQFGEVAELACTVNTGQFHARLSANEEIVIVRATQEALANIRKHANAEGASVTLRSTEDGTMLEITDDGRGFHPAEAVGFGLAAMRARIEEVGGALLITSAPGAGTRVRVSIP